MRKTLIIGITGGSGAGKSTLTKELVKRLGENQVTRVPLDNYFFKNATTNNAPDAIDYILFHTDLDRLIEGQEVVTPKGNLLRPNEILLIEGHLLMCDKKLRERLDLSVFLDLDAEERLLRRVERNVGFGMELQGIIDWFRKDVKDNYLKHIEPSKKLCDLILWGEITDKRINMLVKLIESMR